MMTTPNENEAAGAGDGAPRKVVGRPRRLTLDSIVDAACELGIARLDMSQLAERLNTGVATLYGYVRGREHLLELVAQRLARTALMADTGQPWQEVVREHAEVTFHLFEVMPKLITNLMGQPLEPEAVEYTQRVLAMLEGRGLSRDDAVDLYTEVNQAVIGAAVCLVRRAALEGVALDGTAGPMPLPKVLGNYRITMERIIAGYEAKTSGTRSF